MLDNLKVGDRICTIGGIYGTIIRIKDDVLTIEVGEQKTQMVFARWAVRSVEQLSVTNDSEKSSSSDFPRKQSRPVIAWTVTGRFCVESEGENGKSVFCIQSQRRLVQANDAQKREKRRRGARFSPCCAVLVAAITIIGVAVFALILNWWNASDRAITAINQVVSSCPSLPGVTTAMRGESGGAMRGACVGLLYMALGIVCADDGAEIF